MAKHMPISGFVDFLGQQYNEKAGYILCSYGQNPKTGYLDLSIKSEKSAWKPNGWYYTQYSGSQRTKALYWRDHAKRVFDCQGLSEGYYEIQTGECVNTKARYNYQQWCDPKGSGMIPAAYRVPGAAVFWGNKASDIHHVGYLYKPVEAGNPSADWYIIEARGVMYGVVRTKLYERKPNFWGWMTKYFDYSAESPTVHPSGSLLGNRILKNGCEGEDVKELQTNLVRLGYDLGKWGVDGDFGYATEMAVKKFQRDAGVGIDGQFGPKSLAAMEKALAALETPVEEPKSVVIHGGNCYVRDYPDTTGKTLGVAHAGTRYQWAGEIAQNGWLKIYYNDGEGWVSGKYGRLEE